MDVVELSKLYQQAQQARDESVRDLLAQSVAQAAAAQQALEQAESRTISRRHVTEGDGVRRLQVRLAERGTDIRVDGQFGPESVKALKKFQRAAGLKADGVAGPKTQTVLGLSHEDAVGAGLAERAQAELSAFADLSGEAVRGGSVDAAETLAAESIAAETLAAEAIASEILAAETAEGRFSGEPFAVEAAMAEAVVAEGTAATTAALQAFVADSTRRGR